MTTEGPGRQSEPMGPGRLRGNTTTAEAAAVLEGNPTQEELFTALVTLALSAPDQYDAALVRAAEILTAQTRSQVTEDQVRTVVDSLLSPTEGAGALAGGPPPPPPAEVTEEALPSLRPPIGVFPGFTAQRPGFAGGIGPQLGTGQPGMVEVAPRYRAGDEDRWAAKSSLEIRRQQRELEKAGLLPAGSYTPGFWDQASQEAMFAAMGYANEAGTSWEQILEQLKALPRQVDRREFVAPPELKPDPAALAQNVKAEFRSRLGREPSDVEMAEFAGYLAGQYHAAYQSMVAQARAGFDTETAVLDREEAILRRDEMLAEGSMPGEVAAAGIPATPGPGSFTDVDPVARFNQLFDARFGPEMQFIEGQLDHIRNTQNVMASITNLGRLIG